MGATAYGHRRTMKVGVVVGGVYITNRNIKQ